MNANAASGSAGWLALRKKVRTGRKAVARRESFTIAQRRKATVHNSAAGIVKQTYHVACEDLQVTSLTCKGGARKPGQNHATLDQAIGLVRQQISYMI